MAGQHAQCLTDINIKFTDFGSNMEERIAKDDDETVAKSLFSAKLCMDGTLGEIRELQNSCSEPEYTIPSGAEAALASGTALLQEIVDFKVSMVAAKLRHSYYQVSIVCKGGTSVEESWSSDLAKDTSAADTLEKARRTLLQQTPDTYKTNFSCLTASKKLYEDVVKTWGHKLDEDLLKSVDEALVATGTSYIESLLVTLYTTEERKDVDHCKGKAHGILKLCKPFKTSSDKISPALGNLIDKAKKRVKW